MPSGKKITAATGKSIFDRQPNAKPLRLARTTNLSAETVEDSDSEADSPAPTSTSKPSKTSTNPRKVTKGSGLKSVSSTNATERSDDDTDSGSTDDSTPQTGVGKSANGVKTSAATTPKVNGLKRKGTPSSTSDVGSSSSESEAASPNKKQRLSDTSGSGSSESESTSDEQDDSSASEVVEKPTASSTTTAADSVPEPSTPSVRHKSIPPREFLPPEGYRRVDTTGPTLVGPNEVKDKVLWHITVPSDVPITSLTSIALEAIKSQATILTHDGIRYTLKEEDSNDAVVLLPSSKGYEHNGQAVNRTLRLCPLLDLPVLSSNAATRNAGSQAAARVATAAVTQIKPQPKGLRMRYKPPGSGAQGLGLIGDSSSDDEVERHTSKASKTRVSFQFPATLGGHTDDIRDGVPSSISTEKQAKKSRKKESRKANDLEEAVQPPKPFRPSSTLDTITDAATKHSKDKSKTLSEDDEARAKRKAERKLKTLAKANSKALDS